MSKTKNQRRLAFPVTCVCGNKPGTYRLWKPEWGEGIAAVMACRCLNPSCVDCRSRLCRDCGGHREMADCHASDWRKCYCREKLNLEREKEMAWKNDTPTENALIWNPAYVGREGREMAGIIGDSLVGVCLEVNLVDSKTAQGQKEYHIIIGSDGQKQAEATLKGQPILSDTGFLFICGPSRLRMGSTFVVGRLYTLCLKELKDIGKENKYAVYERFQDEDYISPLFAKKQGADLPF